jgi:hypothetical protein
MRQDATTAFEGFIERKWLDALNVAAHPVAGRRLPGGRVCPTRPVGVGRGR